MKSGPRSVLCLPGESGREFWLREPNGSWKKSDDRVNGQGCTFAIEVIGLDSVPFWAVAPQDGKVDVANVAALKWESLGASESSEGKSWMHWNAGQSDNRVLVASVGLATDAASPEWLELMPESFEMSARLYPVPDGEAAVWMELGRYVIAFMRGERLVHFSALSARELQADAAAEIRELALALEVQGLVTRISGVRLWTAADPGFANALKEALSVRVRSEIKPPPLLPKEACEIFPAEIAREHRLRAQRRQRSRLVFALAAVYVACFAAWAGWLFWREQTLNKRTAQFNQRQPEVAEVRNLQTRWQALDPAVNADAYPTELFQRVVALLPEEGICLKEFHLELDKLVVSGEASTIGHAKKFQADLTGSPGLHQYTWNFPQPQILEDNRAKFRAEGALASGGETHEGQ
jgi:hypothetical protein